MTASTVTTHEILVPCGRNCELHAVTVTVTDLTVGLDITSTCNDDDLVDILDIFGDTSHRACKAAVELARDVWGTLDADKERTPLYWSGMESFMVICAWAAAHPYQGEPVPFPSAAPGLQEYGVTPDTLTGTARAAAGASKASGSGIQKAAKIWELQPVMPRWEPGGISSRLWSERIPVPGEPSHHGDPWSEVDVDDPREWLHVFNRRISPWAAEWWSRYGYDPYTARSLWEQLCDPNPDLTTG